MTALGPGMLVKCINTDEIEPPPPGFWIVGDLDGLTCGVIYTVREVYFDHVFGKRLVRLCEIVRRGTAGREAGFDPSRFIPVDDSRLDIFRTVPAEPEKVSA